MSITVLQPGAVSVTPIRPEVLIELGSILVLDVRAGAVLDDLGASIDAWRSNPWCAVALVAPQAIRHALLAPLLPRGMRVVILAEDADLAASARATVAKGVPALEDCCIYLAARLGPATSIPVSHAIDPDFAGSGPRRALGRVGFPPPVFWKRLTGTVRCVATSIAASCSEERVAERFEVSVKTLSRRCDQLFGRSWPELTSCGVWEAVLEIGLRYRGLASGTASMAQAVPGMPGFDRR
jgi:hypothetical protein